MARAALYPTILPNLVLILQTDHKTRGMVVTGSLERVGQMMNGLNQSPVGSIQSVAKQFNNYLTLYPTKL